VTPVQIAVMALAHNEQGHFIAVWGAWQKAAAELAGPGKYGRMLFAMGTEPGTRELEYQNLGGPRRGAPGRRVHLYCLSSVAYVRELAARCAWATAHKPEGRKYIVWKDVPDSLPGSSTWSGARSCPSCGCSTRNPCQLELPSKCGTAYCVPAGAFGFKRCSACMLREAA
jgi:hypothetical protein